MLPIKVLANVATRESSVSLPNLILVIPLLMPIAGCTNDGAGGPMVSSLSTPTDATGGLDSDQAHHSTVTGSGGEGDEDPLITMTPTTEGITAHLTWDRPPDINVARYTIHYGKRSSENPSAEESSSEEPSAEESRLEDEQDTCARGESRTVEGPSATITGLAPNTSYFFAIRALSDKESEALCSNEIVVVTPPAQSFSQS